MLGVFRIQTQQQESKNRMKHPFRNCVLMESVSVKVARYQTFYESKDIYGPFFWTLAIGFFSMQRTKFIIIYFVRQEDHPLTHPLLPFDSK